MVAKFLQSGPRVDYALKDFVRDLYGAVPKRHRPRLLFMSFLRLVASMGSFVSIFMMGLIIDFFIGYQQGDSLHKFYVYVGVITATAIAQVFLRMWSKFYIQEAGVHMQRSFRMRGFRKLLELDLLWHGKERTGNKIQRIYGGAGAAYEFMHLFSNDLSRFLVDFGGAIIVFLALDFRYLLFVLTFAILFLLVESRFQKPIYERTRKIHLQNEKIAGKAYEAGNNITSIKSLGLHKKFNASMHKEEQEYRKFWEHQKVASQNKAKAVQTMNALGYAAFILLLGFDLINGRITPGLIVTYSGYFNLITRSISQYSTINLNVARYQVKLHRLKEILNEKVQTFDSNGSKNVPAHWKTVSFDNVSFDYGNKHVLNNFNLILRRNEKVGVVGTSGAGKSTLAKLLLRLYELKSGAVRIAGWNILEYKRSSLRKTMTVVPQDQELFNLTLEENITLQSKTKNPALLRKALKVAMLDKLVSKLPKGVKTIVGEKGYRLSGGEKQRVGIARAIYKNAPLLILDEATASLDSETELQVQRRIDALKDVTLLVIAHRLSTLKNMDRIVVLHRGKVVEEGNFKQLIAKRGRFYNLYKKQELS